MIWLTGNKGMLGSEIEILLKKNNMEYVTSDVDVDITKISKIEEFTNSKNVEWIINSAAYTDVDRMEEEVEKAFLVNSQGVKNLAKVSERNKIKLLHFSTDYVFDGNKSMPYKEEDMPNLQNVYGKSKLEGEKFIREILKRYFIIRTAWLYGKNGRNFVHTILRLIREKNKIKVVNDQYGSPTYTFDLAKVVIKIVNGNYKDYGVYNFTNEGITTWHEFAREIYNISKEIGLVKKEVEFVSVKTERYPTPAKRPQYSVLSGQKIKALVGLEIRNWKDGLKEFLNSIFTIENG